MSTHAHLALITGASRGIGRATAVALAARGVRLALLGRASPALDETLALCAAHGEPSPSLVETDLADIAAIERGASRVLEDLGPPDVVVHNAGIAYRERIEALSVAAFREQLDVNLTATFVLTRALLGAMRLRNRGRILFVGSISSTLGTAALSGYCASKWGVVGFMKSLAEELADSGLMTAAVLPGSVDTRMLEGSGFAPRMQPEDVARTLAFLALDAPLAHNGALVEMFGT